MTDDDHCDFMGCSMLGHYSDPGLEGKYCEHHRRVQMDIQKNEAHSDAIKKLQTDRDSWRRTAERLEREKIMDRKQVANLETLLGKATTLGFEVVNAVEAAGWVLRAENSKTRPIEAIRQLREFLCRR